MNFNFFVYILTNYKKSVLYIGVTNDLVSRLLQHINHHHPDSFTARYQVSNLVYWEHFTDVRIAISREKELKGWSRAKKNALIETFNPTWRFMNDEIIAT